jgi:hypothetical protein
MTFMKRFLLFSFCGSIGLAGCRTSAQQSEEKSLSIPQDKDFTLESWTAACERDLNDPVEGAKSKAELMELAGTSNCAKAYPAVRSIFDQFGKISAAKK